MNPFRVRASVPGRANRVPDGYSFALSLTERSLPSIYFSVGGGLGSTKAAPDGHVTTR